MFLITSLLFVGCGNDNEVQTVNVDGSSINPVLVRIVNAPGSGFPDTVAGYQVIVIDPATGVQVGGGSLARNSQAVQQDIVVATGAAGTKNIIVQAVDAQGNPVSFATSTINVPGGGQLVFPSNQFLPGSPSNPGPTPTPTASPSSGPSPSASPAASPSGSPAASPSASPGASPSASPSASPGASPSASPGASPSASPGASPSASPGASPSASPGSSPSASPGASPVL